MERQENERTTEAAEDRHFECHGVDIGHAVTKRKHHSLWRACSTRGVHDESHIITVGNNVGTITSTDIGMFIILDDVHRDVGTSSLDSGYGDFSTLVLSPNAGWLAVLDYICYVFDCRTGIDRHYNALVVPN